MAESAWPACGGRLLLASCSVLFPQRNISLHSLVLGKFMLKLCTTCNNRSDLQKLIYLQYPGHSARQWETFYKERVLPIHQSKVKKLKIKAAAKQTLPSGTKPVRNNTPKRSRNMVGQFTSSPLFAGNGNHETPTDRQTTKSPTLASMVARNGSQESSRSPTFTPASPTLPTQFRERSVESNPVCLTPSQSKLNSDRLLTVSAAYAQLNQTLAAPNEDEQRTPSSEARHISEHTASATRGSPITANGVHIDLRSQTRQLRSEGLASRSELEVEPTERSPDYLREQDREMNYLISLPRETSTTPSPQTRKRILVKDEPGSSPIKPTTPHSSKRSRLQRILNGDLEIPSTPDKLFSSVPPYTPTPIRTRNYRLELDQGGEESEVELGVAASETLSEPEQSASDTQRYFDNAMELPNFDLPERPGGWDDDLSSRCDDDPEPEPGPEPDAYEKDTQAIMNAKAPVLDFAVPEPDSGWDSVLPSSPPILQPSSHPLPPPPTAEEINARLDAWIDSHITTGISEDDVLLALKCTTMHTGLAEVVLKSLVGGKGVPRDVRGIWTEEDDRDLEASDGRVLKALERKHGKEGFDRRWVFLEDYRGEGDWGGVRRCI